MKSNPYIKLTSYLKGCNKNVVRLSFDEIESIIGFKLPDKAKSSFGWWRNNSAYKQAYSWMSAGYRLDNATQTLAKHEATFRKYSMNPKLKLLLNNHYATIFAPLFVSIVTVIISLFLLEIPYDTYKDNKSITIAISRVDILIDKFEYQKAIEESYNILAVLQNKQSERLFELYKLMYKAYFLSGDYQNSEAVCVSAYDLAVSENNISEAHDVF